MLVAFLSMKIRDVFNLQNDDTLYKDQYLFRTFLTESASIEPNAWKKLDAAAITLANSLRSLENSTGTIILQFNFK